jgi:O-antigen ligase
MMFFLPKSQSEMARWLSVAVLGLLVTCYLGIVFTPNLSIHLATDLQEPLLAGDWRGVFGHKNVAAAVMVMMLFLGIYIASSGFWTAGLVSVALALVFLANAGGKSALALGVFTFVLSSGCERSCCCRRSFCSTC